MLGEIWKIGDWLVFPAENTLRRDGSEVKVPPRLMDALIFFARHPDHVISRTELVAHLWNRSVVTDQTVTQNIFELRKALRDGLGRQEAPEYIATVPKRGYQLVVGAELLRCAQEEELAQDRIIRPITIWPTVPLNMVAKTRPKGAVDFTSSALSTMPAATLVERM